MDLDAFAQLTRNRRATRHFRPDPIPDRLLNRLLDTARWAPSGYNLQPTHFVVVMDPRLKSVLSRACMDQTQVIEAPATVVFAGDRLAAHHHLDKCLKLDREAGAINEAYENRLRKYVSLAFDQGPLGWRWLWKATLLPTLRCFRPVPSIPAVQKRHWLAKQVMLSAMVFMLAATAAGLATCPMEGFDARRVRRGLGIPSHLSVCLVIPVGYATESQLVKTRLPLADTLHINGWTNRHPQT